MWKVLIVEDERHSREYVKAVVNWEKLGFQIVGEADNGLTALSMIERLDPDLVISDIIMPELNSVKLLEKARERGSDCCFVMLTCIGDFEYAQKALEFGATAYILKLSMGPESLMKTLNKVNRELWQREKMRTMRKAVPEWNPAATEKWTDHPEINKVIRFIHNHYDRQITLAAMSDYVNMASSYLSDLFKKKTGMTLIRYLHGVRVDQAKVMLRATQMTIGEIADRVGFENVNYFIKIFKRLTRLTPSEYRKAPIPDDFSIRPATSGSPAMQP